MTWKCANTECGFPLRRASVPVAQAPGTQQHSADGLCKRCYNKRRAAAEVLAPQQLQAARNALNSYLKARQTRLGKEATCVKQTKPSKKQPTNSTKCGAAV
jgi:hypothetical protein